MLQLLPKFTIDAQMNPDVQSLVIAVAGRLVLLGFDDEPMSALPFQKGDPIATLQANMMLIENIAIEKLTRQRVAPDEQLFITAMDIKA